MKSLGNRLSLTTDKANNSANNGDWAFADSDAFHNENLNYSHVLSNDDDDWRNGNLIRPVIPTYPLPVPDASLFLTIGNWSLCSKSNI